MPPRLKSGHDVSCPYKTESENEEWRPALRGLRVKSRGYKCWRIPDSISSGTEVCKNLEKRPSAAEAGLILRNLRHG